jgi:hypothetical protein
MILIWSSIGKPSVANWGPSRSSNIARYSHRRAEAEHIRGRSQPEAGFVLDSPLRRR